MDGQMDGWMNVNDMLLSEKSCVSMCSFLVSGDGGDGVLRRS